MNFEQAVRASLVTYVDEVSPPNIPLKAILVRGRRRRVVGRCVTACGGVVVLVLLAFVAGSAGLSLWPNSSQRVTDAAAPIVENGARGPAPIVGPREVFTFGNEISIDGKSFALGNFPQGTGPHIGRDGIAYPADKTGVPHLLRASGERVQLAPDRPQFGTAYTPWVAADSATPLVAWAETAETSIEIVAYNTHAGTEVARRRLACTENKQGVFCPRAYAAVNGVVFVIDGGQTMGWRPADDLWVNLGQGTVSEARGHTLSLFAGIGSLDVTPLGPQWRVLKVTGPYWDKISRQGDIEALLSFDGEWVTDANGLRVENWQDPSKALTLGPPGKVDQSQFDTDGSVLFVTEDPDSKRFQVWDCPPDSKCLPLTDPSRRSPHLMAWDT